jgi:hypothetical protein
MNEEEKKEFRDLKRVRAARGFWTDEEKIRWDELFILQRTILKKNLQDLDKRMDEVRLSKLN